jgi:hypothetical protein
MLSTGRVLWIVGLEASQADTREGFHENKLLPFNTLFYECASFEDPFECPPRTLPGPAGGRKAAEFCDTSLLAYSSTEGPAPCHAISS